MMNIFNIFRDPKKGRCNTQYFLKIGACENQDIFIKEAGKRSDSTGFQTSTTNLCEAKQFRDASTALEFGKNNTFGKFKVVKKKVWLYKGN